LFGHNPIRVSLSEGKRQFVCVFSASLPVPLVTANLRTPAKLEQDVGVDSTINPDDGTNVVPKTIGIDDLSLTPTKIGLLPSI
jgi:hypothetical protein